MKVVSFKELMNVMDAMRMVEVDETIAMVNSTSDLEWFEHANTAAIYNIILKKLDQLHVFDV